jgi:NADH:ubiquinone reductase (H+-translocating)
VTIKPATGAIVMGTILIIGGGFAGLSAALNAIDESDRNNSNVSVTLMSPSPYITIRPRLYEKHPELMREPLAPLLSAVGVTFIEAAAREIQTENRAVLAEASTGQPIHVNYDRLILAVGSELYCPGIPGMRENGFNIDTYESAVTLDNHLRTIVHDFEAPGRDTVVIVGGGMSGIELAAEMRDRIKEHAGPDTSDKARVILVDRAKVVGAQFGDDPRPIIETALAVAGVEMKLGADVASVEPGSITFKDGTRIETATAVFTTGIRASPLTRQFTTPRDELGRLIVDDFLEVKGVSNVYAAGDTARAYVDEKNVALMSCQHSRTMGKYAGYNAARSLLDLPPRPYRQSGYTTCLDLGNHGAVFTTGWDRRVEKTLAEAKQRKQWINSELIYPPKGDRTAILEAMRIDELTGR